jgi:hypothetical protein
MRGGSIPPACMPTFRRSPRRPSDFGMVYPEFRWSFTPGFTSTAPTVLRIDCPAREIKPHDLRLFSMEMSRDKPTTLKRSSPPRRGGSFSLWEKVRMRAIFRRSTWGISLLKPLTTLLAFRRGRGSPSPSRERIDVQKEFDQTFSSGAR